MDEVEFKQAVIEQLERRVERLISDIELLKPAAARMAVLEMMANEHPTLKGLMDQIEVASKLLENDYEDLIAGLCRPQAWHMLEKILSQ